jgi:hypothetical protein
MRDWELFAAMSDAARLATEACIEAGYGRGDKVTVTSARAAADEVHRRERPEDYRTPVEEPVDPGLLDDAWVERADLS